MADLRAKRFNERLKMFTGTINTLASAVLILGFLRRQFDSASSPGIEALVLSEQAAESAGSLGVTVVNYELNVNIIWVTGALLAYAISLALLGLIRDET